jgi:hypothetical protein
MRRPLAVEIFNSRWEVTIIVTYEDSVETFIASADSGLTEGDGIYFGTKKEYDEDMNRLIFNENYSQKLLCQ